MSNAQAKSAEFYLQQSERLCREAEDAVRPSARERLMALSALYRDLAAYRRDQEGTAT